MNDEQLIHKKIIELHDRIIHILDYKNYMHKNISIRAATLNEEVGYLLKTLRNELLSLPNIPYLTEDLSGLIKKLNNEISKEIYSDIPQGFKVERNSSWSSIRNSLNAAVTEISHNINTSLEASGIKNEDCALNAYQVALFALYLREAKIIREKVTDSLVSKSLEALTGYSSNKLRNLMAGENKINKPLITDLEANYDELKVHLSKIIKHIDIDIRNFKLK